MSLQRLLSGACSGAEASYQAVLRAKAKYPGVTRWSVDWTGPVPVARPARAATVVEQQQQRLTRRLQELVGLEQSQLEGEMTNKSRARGS